MSVKKVYIEDSNGNITNDPGKEQIRALVERIGGDLDFCILNLGEEHGFVQAAGSKNRLLIQYRDASGMYDSEDSDFSVETVTKIFSDTIAGNTDWKKQYAFSLSDTPAGGSGSAYNAEKVQSDAKRTLKDHLVDAVKSEAAYKAKRIISKGIGGLFGRK